MTNGELIAFIIIYYGAIFGLMFFVVKWMAINNIVINNSTKENGNSKLKQYRGRFNKKGEFMLMLQLFGKSKFHLKEESLKDYIIDVEGGIPLIGIKKEINIINFKQFWTPKDDKINIIDNIKVLKLSNLRKDLWFSTDNKTKADMLYKIILPLGLIVLAIACLIFFPKMYDKIMEYSGPSIQTATSGWLDSISNTFRPMG